MKINIEKINKELRVAASFFFFLKKRIIAEQQH